MPTTIEITPPKLKAKEFEKLCLIDSEWRDRRGEYTMSRYGVQTSMVEGKWIPIHSLPDFDGVLPGAAQFITDAKVCSQASFPLNDDKFKRRQLAHMMKRSRYGVICFLLIHFNERVMKTKTEDAVTYGFPVMAAHPFWEQFDRGEVKSISRLHCEQYGVQCEWWAPGMARTVRPNLLEMIQQLDTENPA